VDKRAVFIGKLRGSHRGIAARNPRHLHFMIFVGSFDLASRLAGKERSKKVREVQEP